MLAMFRLQDATIAARKATGRNAISTRVKAGKFQIVEVTFDAKGTSTVKTLSDWASADDTIKSLRRIGA